MAGRRRPVRGLRLQGRRRPLPHVGARRLRGRADHGHRPHVGREGAAAFGALLPRSCRRALARLRVAARGGPRRPHHGGGEPAPSPSRTSSGCWPTRRWATPAACWPRWWPLLRCRHRGGALLPRRVLAVNLGGFGSLAARQNGRSRDVRRSRRSSPAAARSRRRPPPSSSSPDRHPVSGGFVKFYLFSAAIDAVPRPRRRGRPRMSVVSAYYYLGVIVAMYSASRRGRTSGGRWRGGPLLALTVSVLVVLGLGVYPGPVLAWACRPLFALTDSTQRPQRNTQRTRRKGAGKMRHKDSALASHLAVAAGAVASGPRRSRSSGPTSWTSVPGA